VRLSSTGGRDRPFLPLDNRATRLAILGSSLDIPLERTSNLHGISFKAGKLRIKKQSSRSIGMGVLSTMPFPQNHLV
jgi:hypothetical protein